MVLKAGTLWESIVRTTEQALHAGAIIPIPTEYEFIEEEGIRFIIRVASTLQRKDEEKTRQKNKESVTGAAASPFLPYEKALFVSPVSDTHIALLNKFNVMEHHLLIVTRQFEEQEALLTFEDFKALWTCMAEYNSIGFYNGGEAAGASQRHKHIQVVPFPLSPEGPDVPIEPLFTEIRCKNTLGIIPQLPFRHAFARIKDTYTATPSDAARIIFDLYASMLVRSGFHSPPFKGVKLQTAPYCLLVTRQWMLFVPRSKECFGNISINALGFAGSLFVRTRKQADLLRKAGPLEALKDVALTI
jgi:ATP adenylyltransferase